MCKATGKLFADYHRLKTTQVFLEAFSLKMGIPINKIIEVESGRYGGSWIHPRASINLAQWCSPEFAVLVSDWVFELMTTGRVELQAATDAHSNSIEAEIMIAEVAARMLRMDDSSKLKMLHKITERHDIPTRFLPDYAENRPTQALSVLLKEHGVSLSARRVNEILIELGILEIKTRPSTKTPGKTKQFKSLTERGLRYGKNLVSPNNPRETQPHYYCDRFAELKDEVYAYLNFR